MTARGGLPIATGAMRFRAVDPEPRDVAVSDPGDPAVRTATFGAVYLVCKRCGKRVGGSNRPKPKEIAGLVRRATKGATPRSRVVLTTCLGLCPKKAVAVAYVAGGSPTRIVAIAARKEVERAVASLSRDARAGDVEAAAPVSA